MAKVNKTLGFIPNKEYKATQIFLFHKMWHPAKDGNRIIREYGEYAEIAKEENEMAMVYLNRVALAIQKDWKSFTKYYDIVKTKYMKPSDRKLNYINRGRDKFDW